LCTSCVFFLSLLRPSPTSTLFPYTTLFRSRSTLAASDGPEPPGECAAPWCPPDRCAGEPHRGRGGATGERRGTWHSRYGARERVDRKSTRLNSSHGSISYAVFCLKKKKTKH